MSILKPAARREKSESTHIDAAVLPDGARPQEYILPRKMVLKALWAFIRRRRRNTWDDAATLVGGLEKQPVIHGIENLPSSGPIAFLPNHYERKDAVWVGWGAAALTNAIAKDRNLTNFGRMRWVMTDTWADCYVGPFHVDPRYLGWVLKGFGDIYGIIRMPAHDLPNHDQQRGRSATALIEIFDALKQGDCVALHPEAGGFETLIQPPRGAGRVVACLDRRKVPVIPVGVYEEDDHLVVNIGKPFARGAFDGLNDRQSADKAMLTIAALVPERTRGVYTERFAALEEEATTAPEPIILAAS
ncbi:MAG: 1-acyl-sn-glycerol-3-phosphate acyltransferase [Thermomicrobiales bacterium]